MDARERPLARRCRACLHLEYMSKYVWHAEGKGMRPVSPENIVAVLLHGGFILDDEHGYEPDFQVFIQTGFFR